MTDEQAKVLIADIESGKVMTMVSEEHDRLEAEIAKLKEELKQAKLFINNIKASMRVAMPGLW